MPNDKRSRPHERQDGGRSLLRNGLLLTLPFFALQLDILDLIKRGMQSKGEAGRNGGAPELHKRQGAEARQAQGAHHPENSAPILVTSAVRFVAREVQALLMILDPSHSLRRRFGNDLEQKLVEEIGTIIKKFGAGSVTLIEVQEIVLKRIIDLLTRLKNEPKPEERPVRE